MKVLRGRNVHEALPLALHTLESEGVRRESRNGPVYQYPGPVTTVYEKPLERVVFWEQRDFNTAFCVYEALWMLAGRNDVKSVMRYVKTFGQYSDDGETAYGAYGYRWRGEAFGDSDPAVDQLEVIAHRLRQNWDDRRCVLQMWDSCLDLGHNGKDVPCNVTATFQVSLEGKLDLVVFNRSNDIIWGAYFANAFHMSVLLEYMAMKAELPVGTYHQVSVNWHAYENVLKECKVPRIPQKERVQDPYVDFPEPGESMPEIKVTHAEMNPGGHRFDETLAHIMRHLDQGTLGTVVPSFLDDWWHVVVRVLYCHELHRDKQTTLALQTLEEVRPPLQNNDLIVSMRQWLTRRIK